MKQDNIKYIYVTAGEDIQKGDLIHMVDGRAFKLKKDYNLLHIDEPAFEPKAIKYQDE